MAQEPQNPEIPRVVVDETIETVRVRRVPKYSVFLVLGGALGVFVAMILTFAFHGTDEASAAGIEYSQTQVFGFLALIGVAVGVAVGGAIALVFDRVLSRRARDVSVDHTRTRVEED
ncbi:potassium transporter Trk [Microbacterium sp. 18062]|uniref:potassium transporter Trk n=1 Tax=Microbacterium sp. 18062 TaxID=2681410 RepID=UPI00135987C3|nr:potassium transporter Trk [Microbacterium sp. 18062]